MRKKEIHYITKKCSKLTEKEIAASAELFTNNYGVYSKQSPRNPGKIIKLGPKYYQKLVEMQNTYVSLAYIGERLIGQGYYVLEKTTEGYLSWIIQLVVHKAFRRKSIGKKLLLSVWGFSNDRAWGLATTNPLTIKTLESSTFRKVSFSAMQRNINLIKQIGSKVNFVNEHTIQISGENATVDTSFFVSHSSIKSLVNKYGRKKWIYGDLPEGREWLAFVFQGQDIESISKKKLDNLFEYSENCLIDAYSRMQMTSHPWAKGTMRDVDYLVNYFVDKSKKIIDFGCGTGRHLIELYKRGYCNIKGIDFSHQLISNCKNQNPNIAGSFIVGDCRYYRTFNKYDYALCLYDVVGSFAKEVDNLLIIENLYRSLKRGGVAFISVMNMELTENIARNVTDIYKNPKKLFKLKASNIMQTTGDIFDPDYFIIDTHTNTVFRKEKFINDGELAAEYIVRDRRYYLEDIVSEVKKIGFKVLEKKYVQAGNWDVELKNTDMKAKEILLVLRK